MRTAWALALCALLLASAPAPAQANIFNDIGNALGNAVGAVGGAVSDAFGAVKDFGQNVADKAVGAWDAVKGWSVNAWEKTRGAFVDAKNWVECTAVDWASFDLETCLEAPPSELCTAACKSNLDKLPGPCLDKIIAESYGQGDQLAFARLTQQVSDCGKTFSLPEGAAKFMIPFAFTTGGCFGVDWAEANTTACMSVLDPAAATCPMECSGMLGKLPTDCIATLKVDNSTGAAEQAELAQLLSASCGLAAGSPAPAPAAESEGAPAAEASPAA